MDEIEAHWLVKREVDAMPFRALYAATLGVPYEETQWIGKLWFEDEDG